MVTKPTKTTSTLSAKTTSTTLTVKPKVNTNPRTSLDMDGTLNFERYSFWSKKNPRVLTPTHVNFKSTFQEHR